jgi:glycosyltransferase involved in cell wall biosynthesis
MHMGVPCLVSNVVGCQQDLVTDGETGWVFRAGDVAHLGIKLDEALLALRLDAEGIKAGVLQRINGYTYARSTDGLLHAGDTIRAMSKIP